MEDNIKKILEIQGNIVELLLVNSKRKRKRKRLDEVIQEGEKLLNSPIAKYVKNKYSKKQKWIEFSKNILQKSNSDFNSGIPKNQGKRWSEKDVDILNKIFHENEESFKLFQTTADKLGRSTYSIAKKLENLGLVKNKINENYPNYGKRWTERQKNEVFDMFNQNQEISEISKKMSRPELSIENLLEKNGLIEIIYE